MEDQGYGFPRNHGLPHAGNYSKGHYILTFIELKDIFTSAWKRNHAHAYSEKDNKLISLDVCAWVVR